MAEPTASHLRRDAYIYVRQSTLIQTVRNTESLLRQYDLAGRARELGWAEHQIVVVDDDLGRSGASAQGREGFSDLVADVGLGRAGIVLSLESSRLARNNSDWYRLLDLCALTDTLIADADGVYHPAGYNDRLVLGLKGTLSECELHLLRSRMTEGLRAKAARGELRLTLPAGLDYDDSDNVIITPDEAVREAVMCVFRRFDQLGSARQVVVSLRADGLRLPRRDIRTRKITWAQANYPAVHDILIHPGYAGVFAYGRSKTEKHLDADGNVITRRHRLPRDRWAVMIPGHHPGYISLDTYDANIARLAANAPPPAGGAGGAAREGAAWLQGLLRCGRCGRLMQVAYHSGGSPAYRCGRANQMYGARSCQLIGGRRLHETVLDQLLAALAPACLAATAQAMADAQAQHRQNLAVFERAAERAHYEADRALRQYDNIEPENRLVARTLEAVLEDKLTAVRTAENQLAAQRARRPVTLTDEETAWITTAGADLQAVFDAPTTTHTQRKELIRAVITEIVITPANPGDDSDSGRTCQIRIIWQGGASTEVQMPLPASGKHTRTTSEETIDLIRRLALRYDDTTIAQILGNQNRRTATGLPFRKAHVKALRAYHGIPGYQPPAENVTPGRNDAPVVSIGQAARQLGVSSATIYRWLRDGFVTGEQLTPGAPWQIRIDQQLRDRIRPQAPDGWLPLSQAASHLGIARQTVLNKVQHGQLNAIYLTQGRRKGLRIQVRYGQAGLFDTP
jgi:DNA invertase Pin-like site-specific DNA recombinase/predicted DNA-binding transcriptional regulator AlpA